MTQIGRSDVIVVGGGLLGLSSALHMRWEGMTVRVLERSRFGDGTSTRGGGWVTASGRTSPEHLALALSSLAYYPEFLDRLGDDCGYLQSGSLVLLPRPDDSDSSHLLGESMAARADSGFALLTPDEVAELEPAIDVSYLSGAIYRAQDGQIDPPRYLAAMVGACRRDGVELHQGAEVTSVAEQGGSWAVETSIGVFQASVLVIAGGPWTQGIGQMFGVSLPVVPVAGQMMTTPPRPPTITSAISVAVRRHADVPACDLRQAWDGRIWMGSTHRVDSWDSSVTKEDTETIRRSVSRLVKELEGTQVDHAWAGVRPIPKDFLPIYGAISNDPVLFVATPLAGFAETPIGGAAVAAAVGGRTPPADIEAFSPLRFASERS